jgi:hypothetical protein
MTLLCKAPGALHMVEQPGYFGRRKIGVKHQACFLLNASRSALAFELVANACSSAVLPNNGRRNGLARSSVPNHACFALVGNANAQDLRSRDTRLLQNGLHGIFLRLPNFMCVMLNPSWLRKALRELLLSAGNWLCIAVEQHRPGAGGALVKCKDVLHGVKINRKPSSKKETISLIGQIEQNISSFEQKQPMAPIFQK